MAAALYDVMLAMDENGTGSRVKVNVTSCITPPNLLFNVGLISRPGHD